MIDLQDNIAPTHPRGLMAAAIVVAFVVTLVCGAGIAAFAGLLPASNHVAAAITVAPLIDLQVSPEDHPSLGAH